MDKKEYRETASMAANGDAKAFSRLYELLAREMYYTAFYSLADDADAIEAVTGTIRDGFNAIGRLRTEAAFRVFMMKTLFARIKMRLREYGDGDAPDDAQPEVKRRLFELEGADRICTVMYIAGKFTIEDISAFSGLMKSSVKKRLNRSVDILELDQIY